tara:strand:- start:132 stop:581 length:450 start_codon:yes stop_codon:yes gene_type:complete
MNNKIFLQWLFLKSNKNIPFNNIEICNLLFNDINRWINNVNDISYIIPENDVLIHFYRFIYCLDNNIQPNYGANYDELFSYKYHGEVVDLFLQLKDKCNSYTVDIFNKHHITADNLMDFINYHIDIYEEINFEDNDMVSIDDEIYGEYE